jgi:protein KTI12
MPLIVITGQPCSGKTTIASRLASLCCTTHPITIIDEESLHLNRNISYGDIFSEKNTRALLRSEVERALSQRNQIVVIDSLNNIKGYRYELWCIARSSATRYTVLHVDTLEDTCRAWNEDRRNTTTTTTDDNGAYSQAVVDDLLSRFERPDSKNKWDSPLFTVRPGRDDPASIEDQLKRTLAAVGATLEGEDDNNSTRKNVGVVGDIISRGEGGEEEEEEEEEKCVNRQTITASKLLVPNMATTRASLTATNLLYEIDRGAQRVIEKVSAAQSAAGYGNPPGIIDLGVTGMKPVKFERPVLLPELRRYKRMFLKLATNQSVNRSMPDPEAAKRMFAEYLLRQVVVGTQ